MAESQVSKKSKRQRLVFFDDDFRFVVEEKPLSEIKEALGKYLREKNILGKNEEIDYVKVTIITQADTEYIEEEPFTYRIEYDEYTAYEFIIATNKRKIKMVVDSPSVEIYV